MATQHQTLVFSGFFSLTRQKVAAPTPRSSSCVAPPSPPLASLCAAGVNGEAHNCALIRL